MATCPARSANRPSKLRLARQPHTRRNDDDPSEQCRRLTPSSRLKDNYPRFVSAASTAWCLKITMIRLGFIIGKLPRKIGCCTASLLLGLMQASQIRAQSQPESRATRLPSFEVVSIKPHPSNYWPAAGYPLHFTADEFVARNTIAQDLLVYAHAHVARSVPATTFATPNLATGNDSSQAVRSRCFGIGSTFRPRFPMRISPL
jgi:hypothetical protein